jgi:hypothetical protein
MHSPLNSSIVTIAVGPTQRLFAAHEDVLCKSPYFAQACQAQFFEPSNKRIELAHEEPEVFSAVLEYLYKGDYSPQLAYDKKRSSFYLSTKGDTGTKAPELTVQYNGVSILKDTAIYVRLLYISIPSHRPTDNNTQCAAPPPRPPSPTGHRSQETRPPLRRTNEHHPVFCQIRLPAHARQRLEPACALSCTHHPKPRHFQAKWHHAG